MRQTILTIFAVALALLTSCRQTSDDLLLYDSSDANMMAAKSSYGEQFKVMWNAMNTRYVAWQVETVDWDAVYDKYLPQFVALDTLRKQSTTAKGDTAICNKAKSLYTEILSPLHDGHFYLSFIDVATGQYYKIRPSEIRNASRADYDLNVKFDLAYYVKESGDIDSKEFHETNANTPLLYYLDSIRTNQIPALMEQCKQKSTPQNELKLAQLEYAYTWIGTLKTLVAYKSDLDALGIYNENISSKVPLLSDILPSAYSNGAPELLLCTTKDNIAYMRLGVFNLTTQSPNNMETFIYDYISGQWSDWYNNVLQLNENGTLKGVVFDLRNNPGRYLSDMPYVYGTLLSEDRQIGTRKSKTGIGRLDYSPDFDFYYQHNPKTASAVNVPVVALTNTWSISMSEITTAAIKQHEKGVQIGTQTWGAACPLFAEKYYEISDYAGAFGTNGETPVYGYLPITLVSFNKYGVVEGKGLTPDIEVEYDQALYKSTGRDNQFERALQYIREQ